MINHETERREHAPNKISNDTIDGRGLTTMIGPASAASLLNPITADAAFVAGEVQRTNRAALRGSYDYVIVGAGAAGSVIAGELAKYWGGKMPDRPADSNAVEAEAYLSSGVDNGGVDLALILEQLPAVTSEAATRFGMPPADTFVIAPALVRPESRGTVRLTSSNWQDPIVINGNYLSTDRDLDAIVRGIELARELGSQSAFDGVRAREVVPGPNAARSDLRELAQLASSSFGHPTGTCRIGTDKLAVVDPELRMHGIQNLRISDSSVMPSVPTAATSAAAHMIGGKAADLLQA